jgi:DNA repair exonuclease SbcCD nuclease subunit
LNHPTILATGDLHLSSTSALAGMRPWTTHQGRPEPVVLNDARRTLDWLTASVREHDVDLLVLAGDIYESPAPGPAAEAVCQAWLAEVAVDAPVAILLGNHDRPNGAGAHALEPLKSLRPGRVAVIDTFQPWALTLDGRLVPFDAAAVLIERAADTAAATGSAVPNLPRAVIFPVPYPSRSAIAAQTDSGAETNAALTVALDSIIQAHAIVARELAKLWAGHNVSMVLLGHGTLRGAAFNEYQTVPLSDAPISTEHFETFDSSIWGHLHQRQGAVGTCDSGKRRTFAHGYVGSPNRHSFGEQDDEKGASLLVGGVCAPVWNLDARRWVTIPADAFGPALAPMDGDVYRVKGEVSSERYEEVAALVRSLKAGGAIIANACTVPREDRGRVEDLRVDLGVNGILDGVFEARPELGEQAEVIRRRVAELGA